MAFSRSGVSNVAWPIRLGLIMSFSFSLSALHVRTGSCVHPFPATANERSTAAARSRVLDKIGGFGESLLNQATACREQTNMAGYKLATYQTSDGPRAGLVIDEKVFDAAKLTRKADYATVLGILEDWRTAQGVLKKAAASAGKSKVKGLPVGRAKLLAPLRWPSAIYCAGANYADHAAEMARRHNRPPEPDPHTQGLKAWHFIK